VVGPPQPSATAQSVRLKGRRPTRDGLGIGGFEKARDLTSRVREWGSGHALFIRHTRVEPDWPTPCSDVARRGACGDVAAVHSASKCQSALERPRIAYAATSSSRRRIRRGWGSRTLIEGVLNVQCGVIFLFVGPGVRADKSRFPGLWIRGNAPCSLDRDVLRDAGARALLIQP